jgi:gliding motility-associated-like protein
VEWVPGATQVRHEPYRFTVTVRDNACPYNGIQVFSYSIHVDFPSFQLVSTAVSCSDSSSGTAQVVSVNASNEQYVWSTGDTTSSVQGLSAGLYTVTVTNMPGGCSAERTIMVDQAQRFSTDVGSLSASCPGAQDGSVQLVVHGGAAPYQESWFSGPTALASRPQSPGTYAVHLVDAGGCVFDTTITIGFDYELSVTSSAVHSRCHSDSTGAISLSITNGQAPFSYVWSNSSTTSSILGLQAGTYSVTVTDHAGCSASLSIPIEEPPISLTLAADVIPVFCKGDSSGRVELQVSGAQGAVSVHWNHGAQVSVLSGVPAGHYSATVTDSMGCRSMLTCTVEEPIHGIAIHSSLIHVRCAGDSTGAIVIQPQGGMYPYSIRWSDGQTSDSRLNLKAGAYPIVVTDSSGCSVQDTITIHQPPLALQIYSDVIASNCLEGTQGKIIVTPSGGTAPYTYTWSHGDSVSSVSVPPGNYSLAVTDGNGCSIEHEFTVADRSEVKLVSQGDPLICPGSAIRLTCSSFPEASYQWHFNGQPLTGATQPFFVTSAPGIYTVHLMSDCGSFESLPLEVLARIPPQVSISNDVILCTGETTRLEAFGGISYRWFPETGLDDVHSSSTHCSPVASTHYTVEVSDAAGCKATASVMVTILCDEPSVSNGFSPNGDGVNDVFFIEGMEEYPENVIHIYNRWGTLVFKEKPYKNSWNGTSNVNGAFMGKDLPSGTYFYLLDIGTNRKPMQGFVYLKRD